VVLLAKGGLDVEETRRVFPRLAEMPFDAVYKPMATVHEADDDGRTVVRCFVKGPPTSCSPGPPTTSTPAGRASR
jgi:Ca2+-transporting ATPase